MSTNQYFEQIGAWPRESRSAARSYVIGFVFSLILTFAAYLLAVHSAWPQKAVLIALIVLACAQFLTQAICFLHLGREDSSRDRTLVLCFASLIVLILVSGSLWIMFSLNERMSLSPAQMEQYMSDQEGI